MRSTLARQDSGGVVSRQHGARGYPRGMCRDMLASPFGMDSAEQCQDRMQNVSPSSVAVSGYGTEQYDSYHRRLSEEPSGRAWDHGSAHPGVKGGLRVLGGSSAPRPPTQTDTPISPEFQRRRRRRGKLGNFPEDLNGKYDFGGAGGFRLQAT